MSDLTDVPGIGAKKERLLQDLGYGSLADLRGANADDLYAQAQFHEGKALDNARSTPSAVRLPTLPPAG